MCAGGEACLLCHVRPAPMCLGGHERHRGRVLSASEVGAVARQGAGRGSSVSHSKVRAGRQVQ